MVYVRSAYCMAPSARPRERIQQPAPIVPREGCPAGVGGPRGEGKRLLAEMEAFVRRNRKFTLRAIGAKALGDPRFDRDLANGRNPRGRVVAKVRAWMREHDG